MDKANVRLVSAVVSDRGLSDKRQVNEDSYLELPERGLFSVADGVGGAQAGDFASQTAMEVLQEAFAYPQIQLDAEDLLERAIQRANASIYQMSHELPQLEMMATTIVALHIDGNIATIGHVGDSRLYRFDPAGNLFRETNDHSMVEEEVRAGRMTLTQAANHPSRNVISRALGADPGVDVEMRTIMFDVGTTFLLCSDGVTRHIQDHELKKILLMYENLSDVCREIKALCYSRGAEDNLTAVVVRVEDAAAPVSFFEVEEETNTMTGVRPVFAPNPLPTLSNGATPRGASATDERKAEFSALDIVNPEAATAPLEKEVEKPVEPTATADAILTSASQTFGVAETVSPSEQTLQAKIDNERIRAKVNDAAPSFGSYNAPEEKRGSFGLVSSLLMLLIGAALGAGLFYGYTILNPPPVAAPPVQNKPPLEQLPSTGDLTPQELNEFRTFERSRRTFDAKPAAAANAAPPQSAADYYLQGRAFLQLGEYDNARQAFNKAGEQLSQSSDGVNPETLRVDIALAQAALGAMTQTASDRKILGDLVKSKQSATTGAPNTNTSPNLGNTQ